MLSIINKITVFCINIVYKYLTDFSCLKTNLDMLQYNMLYNAHNIIFMINQCIFKIIKSYTIK